MADPAAAAAAAEAAASSLSSPEDLPAPVDAVASLLDAAVLQLSEAPQAGQGEDSDDDVQAAAQAAGCFRALKGLPRRW